jgi:UBX domain-containing protein 1/4
MNRFISGMITNICNLNHLQFTRCGPCRASKPQLEELARKIQAERTIRFAIAYEDALGEAIHTYQIRAFPTHVRFHQGKEQERVEGVNFPAMQAMIDRCPAGAAAWSSGSGYVLSSSASSPATAHADPVVQARLARLAKLGGGVAALTPAAVPETTTHSTETTPTDSKPSADPKIPPVGTTPAAAIDVDMPDAPSESDAPADSDVAMKESTEASHPFDSLDAEALTTLTEGMGFSLLKAQKGLWYGKTVEGAIDWLTEHQDDADIDEPVPASALVPSTSEGGMVAQSYKCNDCGKILSNMANLELHANQTGHADFEESTQRVKPLTEEEKQAKIAEIKVLLQAKRAQREEAEKVDEIEREKQRRMMGKEIVKSREQLEAEQRKREAQLRRKEKEDFKRERERIRAELAKDRAERAAHAGKLSSRLGVDGYNPDGIQYDVDASGAPGTTQNTAEEAAAHQKKMKASASKIDEYITKISSYKAGGDGGKCLKILKAYVGNVVDNPDEPKFQSINTENKVYRIKVKQLVGARSLLMAVGFQPNDDNTALVLAPDADRQLLADTKEKLDKAIVAYDNS